MMPLTFLYDEYIDRPNNLKKNPFEYIVPAPTSGVEQKAVVVIKFKERRKRGVVILFISSFETEGKK